MTRKSLTPTVISAPYWQVSQTSAGPLTTVLLSTRKNAPGATASKVRVSLR